MRISLAVLTALLLLACGGDGDAPASTPGPAQVDGEPLTPEDYVPDDIDLDSLNEVHRFCVAYVATVNTRIAECTSTEPGLVGLVEGCMRYNDMEFFDSIHAPECIDDWAAAPCSEIEGDRLCAIVESWVGFGGPN